MFNLKRLLRKLKRKRKKPAQSSTETPTVTSPTTTRPAIEPPATTPRTLPEPSVWPPQSFPSPLSRESGSVASLFPRTTEAGGEVGYLERPYWAPFSKSPARSMANGRTRGQLAYTARSSLAAPALADITSPKGAGIGYSQSVVNAVDSGKISTRMGLGLIA